MGDHTREERCVFLAPLRAGATLGLGVPGAFSPRSGGSRAGPAFRGREETGVSGSEAAPGPAASAHVPLAAGTRLAYPVRCARGSGVRFLAPPAREACSALPEIPYINCGQSPKKHSSLLAAAGRSYRAVRAAGGK